MLLFNHDNGILDNDLNDVIRVSRAALKNSAEETLLCQNKSGDEDVKSRHLLHLFIWSATQRPFAAH